MTNHTLENRGNDESIKYRDILKPYISRWHLFVVFSMISLGVAWVYLRYSTDLYLATATIIIKDTKAGGGLSELEAFSDFGLGNNFNSVENEVEILHSRRLMQQVIDSLDLSISIARVGDVKDSDTYNNPPFTVEYISEDSSTVVKKNHSLDFQVLGNNALTLTGEFSDDTSYQFGEYIQYPHGFIKINRNEDFQPSDSKELSEVRQESDIAYRILLRNPLALARSYCESLEVSSDAQHGSVINLSITLPVKEKAEDILDQLIFQYNRDAINDKNIVAANTIEFISERLKEVATDLDSVEIVKQRYKDSQGVVDIVTETTLNLGYSGEFSKELTYIDTQIQITEFILDFLSKEEIEVLPVNSGIENLQISSAISEYNQAVLSYSKLLKSASPSNPIVQQQLNDIKQIRKSIIQSLDNYLENLEIQRKKVVSVSGKLQSEINQVPEEERIYRDIERNQTVVESIYLLLKQKQEETAITLAVTAPKAKIVDSAYSPDIPVSPKPLISYLLALLVGLALPIGLIYLREIFYNKVENRSDIEKRIPNIGFLGEIPKLDRNEEDFIKENDRSILAESFRILRTNLQFKLNKKTDDVSASKILVTSTIQGEGKTFVAFNLAQTLANSGKRVLLLGADIRNPQLHRYLPKGAKEMKGVTEYLINESMTVKDIVHRKGLSKNLDLILSGAIPPNPAELWLRPRANKLFKELEELYDFIVIDSAPTILVTDTFLIADQADATLYVVRADHSDIGLLDFIKDNVKNRKLNNLSVVLNNVKSTNLGYGNKYGYSYGLKKETLWGRFKKKLGLSW